MVALIFDTAIIYAYVFTHAFSPGTQASRLLVLAVIEAAVRYGVAGGVGSPSPTSRCSALVEYDRADSVNAFEIRNVTLNVGIQLIAGLVVGGLTRQLHSESRRAEARAAEAEQLRDEIGRHADRLEIANRCARALATSLDMKESFQTFVARAEDVASHTTGSRSSSPTTAGPRGRRRRRRRGRRWQSLDDAARGQRARRGRPHRPDARARRPQGRRALRGGGTARRDRHAVARDRAARHRREAARRHLGLPPRGRTPSRATTSTCSPCSAASSRPRSRTSAPSRPSARQPRSCAACPPCAPTSSRS